MFYDRIVELCEQRNITVTGALKEIGLSVSKNTQWKAGSIPSSTNLSKLANYFNVSTDYLIGNDDIKKRPTSEDVERVTKMLLESEELKNYIETYMSLSPEDQAKLQDYARLLSRANMHKDD